MSGKTTWTVAQTGKEKTLYLSTDGNAIAGCKIAEIDNWEDLIEAIYAISRDDMDTIVLDVLDDAVSFAEQRPNHNLE